jgi:hypothetical protein
MLRNFKGAKEVPMGGAEKILAAQPVQKDTAARRLDTVSSSTEDHMMQCLPYTGGQGQDYCQAPDSLFDYGPAADANKLPAGGTTRNIARPKVGNALYGGGGIYVCTKPGQIAMTYDDGPYIYTNELLDLFASYNFKATFCKLAQQRG